MNIFDKINSGIYKNQFEYSRDVLSDYQLRETIVWNEFRADLEKECDVQDNPKKGLLYQKAYEKGHSAGMYEIALVYLDLVDLIR
jgi:hypothetical protein